MVMVELKGLHIVKAKGRTYHYAWRGGPAIKGEPGTPEFQASYNEAVANHRAPDQKKFRSAVYLYKASQDYLRLADSTRRNWSRWLDKINDHFGELSIAQFGRSEKIRPTIIKWRAKFADKPRTADYGMQVLSRVLAYCVDPLGKIPSNPCEGIRQVYSGSRAEIIWTDSDIAHLKKTCSPEIAHAVDLAAHTGLRLGDLMRLCWSHVGEDAIVVKTSKTKSEAIIPLYDGLRDVLARIPRQSPVILTNSKKRPWSGFGASYTKAKAKAWPAGIDLHFHDLRGTAATKFYLAGLSEREIGEIMGWEEESVRKIIRRYVDRQAAIKDRIKKLNEARK
ncbi:MULTISPECIES: site-specific integrase [unclassified Mesorhizobium]|uniref:tyrosine-type recombinase/integrase n=1 Tax=unclassified Mesorhizobium TaxID=325217 RepID=UPI0011293701|nr:MULTISPECIES: site-specific integrase [unclassified Mesorhizobium]TPJ70503.1 site-specific integrase [Mesorhizobium sp. B2-6-7]TPJ76840.1 site-specific integrase [Mesorhizobium sp. B2-6-3]